MLCVHRLVEHLFDDLSESNLSRFDFQIIRFSQSWLANETKKFDYNRAWDKPCQVISKC